MDIFVSYDYDNDRRYKNTLKMWAANSQFDFEFFDQSVDVSVNSFEAAPIRRAISRRINGSDILLCLVGQYTYLSSWVAWEIEKATELQKKIVAVKISSSYTTPAGLYNVGAKWAMSFNFPAIKKAVNEAYWGYFF